MKDNDRSRKKPVETSNDCNMAILVTLLNERYSASHFMRERSLTFTMWVSGFGVAAIWLILDSESLTVVQRSLISSLVALLGIASLYFLASIHMGFRKNRRVMINIEQALGCYEENKYLKAKSLFPPEYADDYRNNTWPHKILANLNNHFMSLYVWIVLVVITILATVWLQPYQSKHKSYASPQTTVQQSNNAKGAR